MGELFVVFFQATDIAGAVGQFVASRDAFDLWFKAQVKDTTDVDLNMPPPGALSDVGRRRFDHQQADLLRGLVVSL
jgi:hypothetical protein